MFRENVHNIYSAAQLTVDGKMRYLVCLTAMLAYTLGHYRTVGPFSPLRPWFLWTSWRVHQQGHHRSRWQSLGVVPWHHPCRRLFHWLLGVHQPVRGQGQKKAVGAGN